MRISINNFIFTLVFVFLFFWSAFRGNTIGNDTQTYLELFDNIKSTNSLYDLSLFFVRYEPAYIVFNYLLSFISQHNQIILIGSSFVIMLGYYKFLMKYSTALFGSFLFFFCIRLFDSNMNTIRQAIAMIIILKSFDYLVDKKLFPFLLTVLIAFLFHRSAIFFVIAWWVVKLPLNFKTYTILFLGAIIASVFFSAILSRVVSIFPIYEYYLGGKYFGDARIATMMNIAVYFLLSIISLVIIKSRPHCSNIKEMSYMLKLVLFGLVIVIISLNLNLIARIADYYTVFTLVLIPNIVNSLNIRRNRIILKSVMLVFLISYYTVIVVWRPEWNLVYPYKTFLE